MRVLLSFAAVLIGCASVASESALDGGADVEDTAEPPRMETATEWPDYGPYDALTGAMPLDGAACGARVDGCGDGSVNGLNLLVEDCANKHSGCGYVYFGIDGEGCATAIKFDAYRSQAEFEACVVAEAATKRFPCVSPGTAHRYVSCTVK